MQVVLGVPKKKRPTFGKQYYYMTNSYRPGLKKFDWLRASLYIAYSPGTSIQPG